MPIELYDDFWMKAWIKLLGDNPDAPSRRSLGNKSPYEVLGVARNADWTAIRAAYVTLVKRWHPDMPDGNDERFQEIQAAYEPL